MGISQFLVRVVSIHDLYAATSFLDCSDIVISQSAMKLNPIGQLTIFELELFTANSEAI